MDFNPFFNHSLRHFAQIKLPLKTLQRQITPHSCHFPFRFTATASPAAAPPQIHPPSESATPVLSPAPA